MPLHATGCIRLCEWLRLVVTGFSHNLSQTVGKLVWTRSITGKYSNFRLYTCYLLTVRWFVAHTALDQTYLRPYKSASYVFIAVCTDLACGKCFCNSVY